MPISIAIPRGFFDDMQRSPFGQYLRELLDARPGLTQQHLARAIGHPPRYVTECMADPKWAKKHGKNAQAPQPEYIEIWANELGLVGEERAKFRALGHQAKASASTARAVVEDLQRELNESYRINHRLAAVVEEFLALLDEHAVTVKKSTRQELKAILQELGADL